MKKFALRMTSVLCLLLVLFVLAPEVDAAGQTIEEVIIQAFEDEVERVEVKEYGMTLEQIQEVFYDLKYTGQLPWYASSFSYNYNRSTGLVTWFWPNCKSKETYNRELYEQKVAEILAETVYPGMSQWQIALSIHDYLVGHFEYDEPLNLRTGYDLIMKGTSVCAGYAEAYMDLMNRVGIPCHYVVSEGMNHAWNIVRIGGNWYHVDATWDDPVSDVEGKVLHDFFLVSDKVITDKNHQHYGWNAKYACTDTSFDKDVFWQDSNSQIIYTSADDCYIRYRNGQTYTIEHRDSMSGKHTTLSKVKLGYVNIGKGKYHYHNNGLSVYNGKVYYSFMETVRCRNLDGSGKEETVYKIKASKLKKCIIGSVIEDGILILTLRDAKGNLYEERVDLGLPKPHQHSYQLRLVESTCQHEGYTLHICSCGVQYKTDVTGLGAHHYTETVLREPTLRQTGLAKCVCDYCGHTYTRTLFYRK